MSFKPLSNTFKQLAPALRIIPFILICISSTNAQSNKSGYTDAARQRLLIRITAHYLFTASQGQIDMDSAVRIPCKVYGLSPLLAYNEEYSDGKPTTGSRLLDLRKVKEAEAMITNLHDEARLRLLIDLGNYFFSKPGTAKEDLEEASKYTKEALVLSKTQSSSWQIAALTLQANLLNQSGLAKESQKIFTEILMLSQRSGNRRAYAQTLLNQGELLHYGDPMRLINFEKALSIFESVNTKEKVIETLSDINVEYFITKRYDLSEQIMRRIIKLQTEINFRQQQYVYDALTWLSFLKGDISSSVLYSDKSLRSLNSQADSVFAGYFFNRRAYLYQYLQQYKTSITWYDKALQKKTDETSIQWYASFLSKISTLQMFGKDKEALALLLDVQNHFPPETNFEKMHFAYRLGKSYDDLRKYNLAEDNYKVFLVMAGKFPLQYVTNEFPNAIFDIANFYRVNGNTSKARQLLEWGKAYTSKLDKGRLRSYYWNLFKVDSTEKNYLAAIEDLQLDHNYLDSIYSNDQRKKVQELMVKYETEKKDKNIKLLNSQNQLEKIRLKEAGRTKNIILSGVLFLMIITGLLFNRYLIKQRSNRELEALNAGQNKLLKEKEWLIKEVHHRVKNNLQMVTSLLYSQTVYLEDGKAVLAVKDSLRRIQAMSLIHQKLYQDENTSTIFMPEYLNDLTAYLNESFDAHNRIIFEQAIEPIKLDVSQAIPLGLIVTESIVNAIKYAFLNGQKGSVSINLHHEGNNHLLLKISDDGVGFPPGFDAIERNSLGIDLMQGLASQLSGSFNIENNNGVHITVRLPHNNK